MVLRTCMTNGDRAAYSGWGLVILCAALMISAGSSLSDLPGVIIGLLHLSGIGQTALSLTQSAAQLGITGQTIALAAGAGIALTLDLFILKHLHDTYAANPAENHNQKMQFDDLGLERLD